MVEADLFGTIRGEEGLHCEDPYTFPPVLEKVVNQGNKSGTES